jgi:hypothetical protein
MRTSSSIVWHSVLCAAVLGSALTAKASHWACLKFPDTEISWYNGGTGDYANIYREEMLDEADSWHNATVVNLTPIGPPAAGQQDVIQSFNGDYSPQPFAGQTIPARDGCTLLRTTTQLNEAVLSSWPRIDQKQVGCHELGHSIGLEERADGNTCMVQTRIQVHAPDTHDIDQVRDAYLGPPPPPDCPYNLKCYPSLHQCEAECLPVGGVCERRINCGGSTAHKCFC